MIEKTINEIVGGTRLSTRSIGDDITNIDILDTIRHVPGAKSLIRKLVAAMFHNGFYDPEATDDKTPVIPPLKLIALKRGCEWNYAYGFGIIAFDGENVQPWNPLTDGTGFSFTKFDDLGRPIAVLVKTSSDNVGTTLPLYAGSGKGFIPLRTNDGLEGPRGESILLALVDVLRIQHEIFLEYMKYVKKQGLAHKLLKLVDLDTDKYNTAVTRIRETAKDNVVIIGDKDDFSYQSPQQNAYDPLSMLMFADQYISRSTVVNKAMLSGESADTPNTAVGTVSFWTSIKEEQDYLLPQILPILREFGFSENVRFNDPTESTLEGLMLAVLRIRQALEGLVKPEQMIQIMNQHVGRDLDLVLELDPKYEEKQQAKSMTPGIDPRSPNSGDASKNYGSQEEGKNSPRS